MATIKGITVQIGSDTTGLQAALKDVNQHSREIASELRQVERLLKFNPHDTELLAQKQQLLSEQVDNTRKKLDTLKTAQEQVNEQLKKGEISEEQHRAFQRELIKTESQLKSYEKQLKAVNIESGSFKRAMDKVGESLEKAGKKMADIGKNLSLKVTAPIVALGAAVTKVGADFEAAMTRSTAIMGDLSDEMRKKLSDTAREIGTSTKFSATEAAEAYEFLASAGYDAERSIAALPKVAAFAQAANADLARATTLLADAQSALGLSSQDATENMENMARVSDVLVLANTLANASTEQFSEALTNKAAAALRLVNKDVEEGVAVLAAYADQGVKGAAAGDQLNIVMRDLQKAAINNKDAFADANITVFDSSGNMRNLADIIGDLEDRFVGMSDEQKRSELMMLGFQDRSVSAMMTLMGTSDAIREYEKALRDAGGTTDEIAQKKLKDFWTQLDLLKKKIIDIGLTLWEDLQPVLVDYVIPALEAGVEKVKALSEWFTNLEPATKKVVIAIAGIVAAIGPALIIIGKMSTGFGALMSTIGTVSAFIKTSLIPAIAGISLPAVATVAAIAALAVVAYEVYRAWDEVKAALVATWDLLKASAVQLGLNIAIAMEQMKHATLNAVNSILERLSVLESLPLGIGDKFAGIKDGVSDSVDGSAKKLDELRKAAEANSEKIADAAGKVKVAFSDLGAKIAGDVKSVVAGVKGMATETADAAEEQAEAVEEAQKEQSKAVEEETKRRTEATRESEEEQTEIVGEEARKQAEGRAKFEEGWSERLFKLQANRLEQLEYELAKELALAEQLGADKTAIIKYYAIKRQEILDEDAEKEAERERRRLEQLEKFEEDWAKKLYLHTANELERLEHEKSEALAKAKELGADKTAIIEYYALRQAEILDRQAEEDRERDERLLASLADFEASWSKRLFEQTADRLEILEREKEEALDMADELGADKTAILAYYANEEAKIRDAQKAEEDRRVAQAEAQLERWEQRLAEQTADEIERLEMRMAEELALAEELGIETAAIVAYYANEKNKILERKAEEAERIAKAEAEAEIVEEQRKYDEIERIEADYRRKLFELTADRIDILEKEKEDQIAIAKAAGADWLLVEEYYNALIEEERERRADELAKIAEAEAEAEKAAHEKAKQARLSFEKQWQDKLTKLTAKTAEDRLKILDAEHKKVLEEAEKLGADVEAVNRYYGEKRLKLEQEIADQHLTIWQQTAKRLKTEFENAFDEIGKTVEKAMVDVGNMLLEGGSDWKAILVTALSAVINQIIVAAVAAMGIAELVSKALSQMWNPLGWVIIAGLLVALAAIRNSLASQLGSGIKGGGGAGGGTGGGGGGGSTSKPSGGRQVSEITGPSRDLLTDLLAPLAHLSQIVAPIQDIRNMLDARLPHPGDFAPAGAVGVGGVSVTIQTLSINAPTATVGDIGKLTIDEIERALASRLAFGRRGRAGS